MKINGTIIILDVLPQMHLKNYLYRNLRQPINFSSGSICTQIAWRSIFFCNLMLPDRDFGVDFGSRDGDKDNDDGCYRNASYEGDGGKTAAECGGDGDGGRRCRALWLDGAV